MADFLTRLAERTLGVAPVAQPIIASMFANGRTVANSPSVAEGFTVQDDVAALTASQAPAVHPARTAQSAPSLQTAPPASPVPPGLTAKVNPTIDAATQNPRAISRTEPSHQQPATMVKGSMLPAVDRDSREEHVAIPYQVSILPGDRRGRFIAPTADLSARSPDPLPSSFTLQDIEPPDLQAAKVPGIVEVDPPVIIPQSATAQVQRANRPLVSGRLRQRQESLPSQNDAWSEHVVHYDTSSATSGEIAQDGQPGGTSPRDIVSPRPRNIETQSNPRQLVGLDSAQQASASTQTQQQQRDNSLPERQTLLVSDVQVVPGVQQHQETSPRQQTDLPLTSVQSGNPASRQRQLPPSLLQNQQVITSQRLPAPVSEAASSTPTIRVTIGRIDVRAVTPPAPPPRPKQARPGPTLSLDDYARQRKGGER
jgi:hypothetical protein